MLDARPTGDEAASDRVTLAPIVDELVSMPTSLDPRRHGRTGRQALPSRDVLLDLLEKLRRVLFPGYFSDWDLSTESLRFYVGATLDQVVHALHEQVRRGFCLSCAHDPALHHACFDRSQEVTRTFISHLPELRRLLAIDVEAAYEGDPATSSRAEIIFSYPGLRAITVHRLAHELYRLEVPLIPRILAEHAHSVTGIDIHPGARIGEHFFIDHGTGVVIGETCVIGRGVRIYQGVTLGAKSFPLDAQGRPIKGIDRHPVVEDDVIIYSGATILGRVTIGSGSIIGGNVWLTHSVPAGSSVTQGQPREGAHEAGSGI